MNAMQSLLASTARFGAIAGLAALLGACASTSSSSPTNSPSASESSSTTGANSEMGNASSESIAQERATIRVAGLACPKCATNVDRQLTRIAGVRVDNIDMKNGLVLVRFEQQPHPSPAQLARAVEDAGLTFLGVQSGSTSVTPMPPANPMLSER